jgi:stearoyl-CoA desaturase (delta-9 desaturase)
VLYYVRVFFITAGYHRYFSHRSYQTNRLFQFILAFGGCTSIQKGPLWWAAHHRHHHKHSDMQEDIHSPKRGFWWSQVNWILCPKFNETRWDLIPDFAKYPELRFLNRHPWLPPLLLGAAVLFSGLWITGTWAGAWGIAFIGFFLSTVFLWHGTFSVNSLAHVFGRRRYATRDTSRNSLLIALVTGGEGWHNNHHHYAAAARQGFFWYEIDLSYYVLVGLSKFGIVSNLRQPPERIKHKHLIKQGATDLGMFQKHWERALTALANAQAKTGELAIAQKQALEELIAATRAKVEEIARLSGQKGPAAEG